MNLRHQCLRLLTIILILPFFGCATLLDPWKQAAGIDFQRRGVLIGHVRLEGQNVQDWRVNIYAQNMTTQKILPIEYWRNGFIAALDPGSYRVHIAKLSKISSSDYYTSNYSYSSITTSEIPLNYISQVYQVKTGDALYIGDFHILLGKPSALDLKNGWTWVGLLAGVSERQVNVAYLIRDNSADKLKLLRKEHPIEDYRFVTELFKL